jgi:LPXTG-motif cell wall-anchored protein
VVAGVLAAPVETTTTTTTTPTTAEPTTTEGPTLPSTTVQPTTTGAGGVGPENIDLPQTGANTSTSTGWAVLLTAAGAATIAISRRRRAS